VSKNSWSIQQLIVTWDVWLHSPRKASRRWKLLRDSRICMSTIYQVKREKKSNAWIRTKPICRIISLSDFFFSFWTGLFEYVPTRVPLAVLSPSTCAHTYDIFRWIRLNALSSYTYSTWLLYKVYCTGFHWVQTFKARPRGTCDLFLPSSVESYLFLFIH
jgi:hypothetical protein